MERYEKEDEVPKLQRMVDECPRFKRMLMEVEHKRGKIICSGRGKGKMMNLMQWIESLPEDERKNVICSKDLESPEKLKGLRLRLHTKFWY